jgi:hypothetical protein
MVLATRCKAFSSRTSSLTDSELDSEEVLYLSFILSGTLHVATLDYKKQNYSPKIKCIKNCSISKILSKTYLNKEPSFVKLIQNDHARINKTKCKYHTVQCYSY